VISSEASYFTLSVTDRKPNLPTTPSSSSGSSAQLYISYHS